MRSACGTVRGGTEAWDTRLVPVACEKGRQWLRALGLFEEMSTQGLLADGISYSAAISACEEGKQWQRALELVEETSKQRIQADVISNKIFEFVR